MTDILVVDDDEGTRKKLTEMLERAGFMVTAVDSGLAAITVLERQQVTAIVSDFQMPFLEGGRFFDELSSAHPDMSKKVIFVTGHGSDEHVRELAKLLEVVRDALDRDPSMQVEGDADLVAAELERGES